MVLSIITSTHVAFLSWASLVRNNNCTVRVYHQAGQLSGTWGCDVSLDAITKARLTSWGMSVRHRGNLFTFEVCKHSQALSTTHPWCILKYPHATPCAFKCSQLICFFPALFNLHFNCSVVTKEILGHTHGFSNFLWLFKEWCLPAVVTVTYYKHCISCN